MPVIDIAGITIDVSPDAARVAQSCMEQLRQGATALLANASQWDSRIQPALTAEQLAPVFAALVDFLQQSVSLLKSSVPSSGDSSHPATDSTWDPAAVLRDLIQRYLDSIARGLERLLTNWNDIGPIFFTTGTGQSLVRFQPASLLSITPLHDALGQGGVPSLTFHFTLARVEGLATASGTVTGRVVYLPRDVEADYALVADTSRLCIASGVYQTTDTQCDHPWCRSIAERINATIGEPGAIPTFVVWPAQRASSLGKFTADAYGYREYLSSISPDDTTVSPGDGDEATSFFRILGRHLGLAYAMCINASTRDFIIHARRPYWVDVSYAFEAPFADLQRTGMFTSGSGPLAPQPRTGVESAPSFGLMPATNTPPGTPPARLRPSDHVDAIVRGCQDVLEVLATLAPELTRKLQLGTDLLTRYRPRSVVAGRDRQASILELLSTASSWVGWDALEQISAEWRAEENAAWTDYWFSLVLSEISTRLSTNSNTLQPEVSEAIKAAKDRIAALVNVASFQKVDVPSILALPPVGREAVWNALVSLAAYLAGLQDGTTWDPELETRWSALPTFALVDFELADHLRARLPYFIRRLQSPSLWGAEDGTEIDPSTAVGSPPPWLQRNTYFPSAMAIELGSRLTLLQNPGVRARLLGEIPRLITG